MNRNFEEEVYFTLQKPCYFSSLISKITTVDEEHLSIGFKETWGRFDLLKYKQPEEELLIIEWTGFLKET